MTTLFRIFPVAIHSLGWVWWIIIEHKCVPYFRVDLWGKMLTWACKWLLGGDWSRSMPLRLGKTALSRIVPQIMPICEGHPVLASASNHGWPPIKTYLFGGLQFCRKVSAVEHSLLWKHIENWEIKHIFYIFHTRRCSQPNWTWTWLRCTSPPSTAISVQCWQEGAQVELGNIAHLSNMNIANAHLYTVVKSI